METRFVCAVCQSVFSEHQASVEPVEFEEDQIRCPNCGSAQIEPDHFDPGEPVENPFEEPEENQIS